MDRKEWNTSTKEFKRSIKESMRTGDFKGMDHEIGDVVSDTVDMAINEVRKAIGSIQFSNDVAKAPKAPSPPKPEKTEVYQQPKNTYVGRTFKKIKKRQITFAYNPIGKVSGMVLKILGMIGSTGLGIAIMILAIIGMATGSVAAFTLPIGIMMPFFVTSLILQSRGSTLRNRYKRFDKYLHIIGNRHFIELYEVMELSGFSYKYVIKDLKKMIRIGMFPQASLDTEDGMLYLSRGGYEQYRYLTGHEQAQVEEKEEQAQTSENSGSMVARMGRDYLQRINDLRVKLKDTDAVNKIIHMEAVLIKIIEYIEKHPDQKDEVRRLMDYYLPTTIKLLMAYYEFEQQPIQGENILRTKQEIKQTLDTINSAFEKLLDQLFKDLAWDISTDISVMETMLAQEGLAENTINKSKTMGE
ncbi:5-bromo-4-chloroindolyl phosphate hydrolysis family protein [Vallitaleaceae bacterium 9-2]